MVCEVPRAALGPGKNSTAESYELHCDFADMHNLQGVGGEYMGYNSHTRTHSQVRRRQTQERSRSCAVESPRATCSMLGLSVLQPTSNLLACWKLSGTEPASPRLIMRLSKTRTYESPQANAISVGRTCAGEHSNAENASQAWRNF